MAKEYFIEKFDNGMHYIRLDQKTVSGLIKNNNKRVVCTLNKQIEVHAALMPKKEGGYFITLGAAVCKKLKIKAGSKVTAAFAVDTSPYQFEMPAELKEVLNTDPEGDKVFHALTKGNQRGLIYLVTQVKAPDKRIERALKVVEKIKSGITSPTKILK